VNGIVCHAVANVQFDSRSVGFQRVAPGQAAIIPLYLGLNHRSRNLTQIGALGPVVDTQILIESQEDKKIMRGIVLTVGAAAIILTTGALTPNRAEAAPIGSPATVPAASISPIDNVALCFYVDGWNGPGMYECGFRFRHGEGWHGRREEHHEERHERHERHEEHREHGRD
jgi:hypothetical protein